MTTATRRLELTLLPESLAVSQLAATAPIPEWAMQGTFFSVTRTRNELSIVCEHSRVPASVRSQPGWSVFEVHGPFAFTETGVLSSLASPLAEAKLSLFTISTFDTDYLLVASDTLSTAVRALKRAGHKVHRSQTE